METVMIPIDRIAVLIGTRGSSKREIEAKTGAKLQIDEEGQVLINARETYAEYITKEIVKAVGRGFSPETALRLCDGDYYLKVINLEEALGSEKAVDRQKARIIGENGRTKEMIEECSGAKVCIYGGTVSFIGLIDEISLATEAVEKLLDGKPHSVVYKFLEHGRKLIKEERIAHMWEPAPAEPKGKKE